MKNFVLSIPLYHVDSHENNDNFCNGQDLKESIENGKWAGTGVYFWDNEGNAKYWINSHWKNNKNAACVAKTQLKVNTDQLLDLTEPNAAKEFESSVKSISKLATLCPETNNYSDLIKMTSDLGEVINLYYGLLDDFGYDKFSVIKIIGYYPFAPDTKLFKERIDLNNHSFEMAHVTIKAKTIYLIKDQKLLSQRIILHKTEED